MCCPLMLNLFEPGDDITKMATITICNRLNGKTKRLKVEGVNINSKVAEFRSKVSSATEAPIHEIGK